MIALVYILWVVFAYLLAVAIGFIYKPKLPTILLGFILGDVRLENDNGDELMIPSKFKILFFQSPIQLAGYTDWYVSHLQYKARAWVLLCWPTILHICFWQPRFQKYQPGPTDPKVFVRVPGTEIAFYGRLPGWRKQKPDPKPYILTKGYPPFGHLD